MKKDWSPTITVRRKQQTGEPIEAFATLTEVGARMTLADFIGALADEAGNPSLLLTKAQLKTRLLEASERVRLQMQDTTRFVV